MEITFYIISCIILLVNILPFSSNQHWFFRVWDFGRIQLLFLLLFLFIVSFVINDDLKSLTRLLQLFLLVFILYNIKVLVPYTRLFSKEKVTSIDITKKKAVSIISVNVYQFNTNYDKLIELVRKFSPDIVLTMESNMEWENGLKTLEIDYPNFHKVALENTYGMHFYTKLKIINATTNYFVSDDIPSFEIVLETKDEERFTFFGVHPPPPSPIEEENSKERDGELLCVAKQVIKSKYPVIVSGDFNNVAWAKSSILFKKMSHLIDPRIGRGFVSTFHAKYKLLRFPIDLFFHSETIFIGEFMTLQSIDSDHLPLYCEFYVTEKSNKKNDMEKTDSIEEEEIEEMIVEGKKEESDRAEIAEE